MAEDGSGVLLVESEAETAVDEGSADEGVAEEGSVDKVVDVVLQPPPRFLCLLAFRTDEAEAVTVVEAVKTSVLV